jgi:4-alpha-glucanotransferase
MADPLRQLAESYGIQTSYLDVAGRTHEATPEALLAVLRVLGAPLEREEQAAAVLQDRLAAEWRRPLNPVVVAWDGRGGAVDLRLPEAIAVSPLRCELQWETGGERSWDVAPAELTSSQVVKVGGVAYRSLRLPLPEDLPPGYHRLVVHCASQPGECLIVSAPTRAHEPEGAAAGKTWGVFLPLYALRSQRDWGCGDFTDLQHLVQWVQRRGGGLVGTLPLLAAFLDQPFEPSPYSPASRLFWNELYLDVERIPELAQRPEARSEIDSHAFHQQREALRSTRLVDYRGVMAQKRRVLQRLSDAFFTDPQPGRAAACRRFIQDHPRVEEYARFRAAVERFGATWWVWPEGQRSGWLREGDYDETARRYHLFVQWQAHEQLAALAQQARTGGPGLYLDLPLGVNADSFEVWSERRLFALGASGGAPPDLFFTKGQDWGFPPLHPETLRAQGYRYLRDCLRNHMQYAGVLRVDHLMGLHRLYWVPQGLGPQQGVYVRYRPEEMYAIFALESVRHRTLLVGEDLGTVPPEVRPAMERHHVHRLFVVQYELQHAAGAGDLPEAFPGAVASVNTHDMPTFSAYWRGLDLADRHDLGLLDEAGVREEEARRAQVRQALVRQLRAAGELGDAEDESAVLRALFKRLARSDAAAVLASLEDLWQAIEPQNVPGTWKERPNWQRKAAHTLEELDRLPAVVEALRALNRAVSVERRDATSADGRQAPGG